MITSTEFFRLSLTRQCTLLDKEGYLLGSRQSNNYKVRLYLIYDFLVEVYFENGGWISSTSLPEPYLLNLYPHHFGEA
ncbi:hypothetical protein [Rhodoflexus caldus]|uniref:hypothetical protein n=1 Tax=Rhodoflexus caldus TaxID=2891236 RepID=UPI00202A946B|nr:hypothetical protein [Rhodoflexus caldus]